KRGFVRSRVDGQIVRLSDDLKLDRRVKHFIEIVIDRLKIEGDGSKAEAALRPRLAEAVEQALGLSGGSVIIAVEKAPDAAPLKKGESGHEDILLSAHYACTYCERSYEPPSPQLFSFNSPQGMCPDCDGLGTKFTFDP